MTVVPGEHDGWDVNLVIPSQEYLLTVDLLTALPAGIDLSVSDSARLDLVIGSEGPPGPPGGPPGPPGPQGPAGGALLTGWWQYSDATVPPPGLGQIRTSGTGAEPVGSTVSMWLSHTDDDGLVWGYNLAQPGHWLLLRDAQGNSWEIELVTVTDYTDYAAATGTVLASTGVLAKNRRVQVNLILLRSGSDGAPGPAGPPGPPGPPGVAKVPYVYSDTRAALTVGPGTMRVPNATGANLAIRAVRVDVTTAPTGAALIVDVNKSGGTIFTTQSNRPQVTAGNFFGVAAAVNIINWTSGDYLTVDIDQVGSVVPGGGMTVTIIAEG